MLPLLAGKLIAVQVCGLRPQRLGLEEPLGLLAPFPTVNRRRMNSAACWAFPRPAADSTLGYSSWAEGLV